MAIKIGQTVTHPVHGKGIVINVINTEDAGIIAISVKFAHDTIMISPTEVS
ncbi:hypothetical protein ACTJIJ_11740 [Niabella sp. 22666]|uniref:hypothetical protein n=1 Tax=Niabella sp. 22666 TaxID=3453954 RepID=UPI003F864462